MTLDEIEIAHTISFDENSVQCGRVHPIHGDQMGNLTARGSHLTYVVLRQGDPLVHRPGGFSSRTACGWWVVQSDTVDVLPDRIVTCVRCLGSTTRSSYEDAVHIDEEC